MLLAFVSPSLRNADIQTFSPSGGDGPAPSTQEESKRVFEVLLHSLQVSSPHLEHLKIGVLLTPNTEFAISQFAFIQVLDMSMAGSWRGTETFYALGTLQRLVELSIVVTGLQLTSELPSSLFTSLQSLSVCGSPLSVGAVLKVLSSAKLQVLHIRATHSFAMEEWELCLSQIPAHLAKSLKDFKLECLRGLHSLSDKSGALILIASPMVRCCNLEKVAFDLEGPLHASDADVEHLVSAWSKLQEFRLWFHLSGNGPTLHLLSSCASLCQSLQELEIPMDARGDADSLAPDTNLKSCSSMRRLAFLGNAKITVGEGAAVGRRIYHLFPNLRKIDAYNWQPAENNTWRTVRNHIPSLTDYRTNAHGKRIPQADLRVE